MPEPAECYDKEVLEDGIIVYRVKISTGPCADLWFDDIAGEFEHARLEKRHIRLVYDLCRMSLATPYMMQRMQQLSSLPTPENWHVASIASNAFAVNVVKLVKNASLMDANLFERSQIFSREEEALAWLRSL
jgi:hypothetical protein